MENEIQQVKHVYENILLSINIISLSVSIADVKEMIQIYSAIVAAVTGTLAAILYIIRIRKERAAVKELGADINEELKKNCP